MTTDLNNLNSDEKQALRTLLAERELRFRRRKLYTFYPDEGPLRRELYHKHTSFFEAGVMYRERCVMAGNRTGKTEGITCYELTLHLTGRYPDWWVGRRFNKPIMAWAAGTTAETTRDILQKKLMGTLDDIGTGLIPHEFIVDYSKDTGIPDALETVQVRHITGGISRLQFKAYKQGRKGFEGAEQDVILLDEEPPLDVYSECVMRTMTTDGIIMLGFTPLEGLSETVLAFMPGGQISIDGSNGSRFMVNITWDEAPHLTQKAKDELWGSTPQYMRLAKSKGIPNIGSGAVFPYSEDDIKIKDFEVPEYWPQVYGFDVGWKATAATRLAWDRHNDVVYVIAVYKKGHAEPVVHADAIKRWGEWIPGVSDPAAHGRSQEDGKALFDLYIDLDLNLSNADNTVEAGLFDIEKRITTGKIKVFASCVAWFDEYRIYRRDKHGHVVKENDHLMDTTRYAVRSGLDVALTQPRGKFKKNATVTEIMDSVPIGR